MVISPSDLSGSWFGNYYYASGSTPFAFEAVFLQMGSSVTGNILDLGRLGEATVAGTFSPPKLKFTKMYYKGGHSQVTYRGTISEDGKTLSGSWEIVPIARGSWIAWRVEEKDEFEQLETEVESQKEKEEAPLVEAAPGRL